MNEPLVSITVPIYKTEKYLENCINSLINQTYSNIEIILVDDGSPDECPRICDLYAEKDSRIKVIHAENGGASAARNRGIKASKGEYIVFCDSDDYVAPQWCEYLLKAAQSHRNAAIFCNIFITEEENAVTDIKYDEPQIRKTSYYEMYKSNRFSFSVNKIFRKDIISDNNLLFDKKYYVSEDSYFAIEYLKYCNEQIYIENPLYYYVQRNESIMHTYRSNDLELHLSIFYSRIHLMEENLSEYCDDWLYRFIVMFENTFDKRNEMSFLKKMKSNQKAVCSEEFQFCLNHASGKNENPKTLKFLRNKNYYFYWIYQQLYKIKKKIK